MLYVRKIIFLLLCINIPSFAAPRLETTPPLSEGPLTLQDLNPAYSRHLTAPMPSQSEAQEEKDPLLEEAKKELKVLEEPNQPPTTSRSLSASNT